MFFVIIFLLGMLAGRFLRFGATRGETEVIPLSAEMLYYLALPKIVLVRLLMLRDVQLKNLLRRNPQRVRTTPLDRLLILALIRGLPAWKDHVFIVSATAVRNWMLQFPKGLWSLRTWIGIMKSMLLHWIGIRKKRAAHKRDEILAAIRTILSVDSIRGVDRIHGELKRLGFRVSRPTIARYLRKYFPEYTRPPHNGITPKQLLTSIMNAWAVDFLVVLTFFGKALYVFFVIDQGSRAILHVAVTFHPSGLWVTDQMNRVLAKHPAPEYLISDNDPVFRHSLGRYLKAAGIKHLRINYRSPWQNGIAERWVQTVRRELFDRVPIFSSRQAERLLSEYIPVYNYERTHLALAGDTPCGRTITPKPSPDATLESRSYADGLSHTFHWEEAA